VKFTAAKKSDAPGIFHAIGQADTALGVAGLRVDNIFRVELREAGDKMQNLLDAAKRVDAVSRGEDEWNENNVVEAIQDLRKAIADCGAS
jgi:hypothetical protein